MALDKLEVIGILKKGIDAQQTAKIFDCSASAIEKIEKEAHSAGVLNGSATRRSRAERAAFREQIANWVAKGHTVQEAAKHFHTSDAHVRTACEEHSVTPKFSLSGKRAKKASQIVVIAMMIDGMGQSKIAETLGVSRQYVNICANAGRTGGIFDAVERAVKKAATTGTVSSRETVVERTNSERGLDDSFRHNLRRAYETIGLSQRRLAAVSRVHFTYINDILQGRSVPTLTRVQMLISGLRKEGLRDLTQDHLFMAPKDFSSWLDERQSG